MKSDQQNSRTFLEVPYGEKNEAKALGAWWDPDLRKWFVPAGVDPKPFSRWYLKAEQAEDS